MAVRPQVREALAAAAQVSLPPTREGFYPCELSADSVALLQEAAECYKAASAASAAAAAAAAAAAPAAGAAAMGDSTYRDADAAALGKLDELLAVAASAGDVIEGSATDLAREAYEAILEEFDAALVAEKEEVALLGGLHVIGTNLHDSQRIDDQLRGRAGRQGDPGSTHFFLSLEDRIFRVFGGDKVGARSAGPRAWWEAVGAAVWPRAWRRQAAKQRRPCACASAAAARLPCPPLPKPPPPRAPSPLTPPDAGKGCARLAARARRRATRVGDGVQGGQGHPEQGGALLLRAA